MSLQIASTSLSDLPQTPTLEQIHQQPVMSSSSFQENTHQQQQPIQAPVYSPDIPLQSPPQQLVNTVSGGITQPQHTTQTATSILDKETLDQFMSGLQKSADYMKLNSRDIPTNTEILTKDPNIIPDYIPPTHYHQQQQAPRNYHNYQHQRTINDDDLLENDEVVDIYNKRERIKRKTSDTFDELNLPIMIAVLYFLFQLPFVRTFFIKNLPFLFKDDYSYNLIGYIFVSIFFSMIFYIINKFIITNNNTNNSNNNNFNN